MKRTLFAVGLPIAAGLTLTLTGCGNPAVEREDVQQPGAVPTQIGDDEEDRNVPGKVTDQDDDEDGDND
ncbi:hypothetical protein [Leptolyngbya ohadii]|uniref:hypothetical protein n=1 Tax=Leptolyngbya ohadii TaxID=1962290 RepID=UPI00117B1852|nr:hypothetical protein [Leptolyngbya ohadii]